MILNHDTEGIDWAAVFGLDPDIDWQADALCQGYDPEIFFPEKGGSTRDGKAVCARCPVVAECLQYAIDHQERFGIFGGLSERERRRLIRARMAAA